MIRVLLAASLFSGFAYGQAPVICRGKVRVPEINIVPEIALILNELKEGSRFSLGSPITEDIEPVVRLTIQKVIPTSKGALVFATYDLDSHSFMYFEYQRLEWEGAILSNFKGFERKFSFGPVALTCRPD